MFLFCLCIDNFQCCCPSVEFGAPRGAVELLLVSDTVFSYTELTEHGKKPKSAKAL